MYKVITALGFQELNNRLKTEENIEIVGKDIQYKDGVIEMMEENSDIDVIIVSNLLLGDMNFKEFINHIKEINYKIRIIAILDKEDQSIIKFLRTHNISIFLNNEIKYADLIRIINENNLKDEINELKKIILNNNKKSPIKKSNKLHKIINNFKEKFFSNTKKDDFKSEFCENSSKIIFFLGANGIGKSTIIKMISSIMKNRKILIVDLNFEGGSINVLFGTSCDIHKSILSKNEKNTEKIIKKSSNLDLIFLDEKTVKKNEYNIEIIVEKIINNYRNSYDFIFFDTSNFYENSHENFYKKLNLKMANFIFFIVGTNLIELKKSKRILKNLSNNNSKIKIIINKRNKYSLSKKILDVIFSDMEIIGDVKYSEFCNLMTNKELKNLTLDLKEDVDNIRKFLECTNVCREEFDKNSPIENVTVEFQN